jgi:membrane dipeptidase
MLVDCSHTGYKTSMDTFEVSASPVIFSHSNAKSIWDHDRNIRDDQIRACAKSGGVIGVAGFGPIVADNDGSPEAMFRHIDFIGQLVGLQHVGIGLDFVYFEQTMYSLFSDRPGLYARGYRPPPWPFVKPEQMPRLTEVMLQHGYTDDQARGVLGENWLRVAERVWR